MREHLDGGPWGALLGSAAVAAAILSQFEIPTLTKLVFALGAGLWAENRWIRLEPPQST